MTRVKLVVADYAACGHYRMIWPAQGAGESFETTITEELRVERRGAQIIGAKDPEADVVVLQRPLQSAIADTIPFLQERGVAVVVEVDDDFAVLPLDHPEFDLQTDGMHAGHLARACASADLVTAPTQPILDRYAPEGRGYLIRNYIPRWMLDVRDRRNEGRTLGWSGIRATHPGDLEETGGAIDRILDERPDVRFHVVGPPEGVTEALRLDEPAWGTGQLSLPSFIEALGTIDVGIIPLAPNEFNVAKSPLKGIEFAAAGVPFVASPTPEYRWLAEQGIGLLAYDSNDWVEQVGLLLDDPALRRIQAAHGREIVRERFLLRDHARQWEFAWQQAVQLRRELSVTGAS